MKSAMNKMPLIFIIVGIGIFFLKVDICLIYVIFNKYEINYSVLSFSIFLQLGIFTLSILFILRDVSSPSLLTTLKELIALCLIGFFTLPLILSSSQIDGALITSQQMRLEGNSVIFNSIIWPFRNDDTIF